MSIEFSYLPHVSSRDFVAEKVDQPPPTKPTIIVTPPPEAAADRADVLDKLQQESRLARHSHPSQTQPPSTPLESTLHETSFQDLQTPDSPPLGKTQRAMALKPVENPKEALPAISSAAVARLEEYMKSLARTSADIDAGVEPPANSANENKRSQPAPAAPSGPSSAPTTSQLTIFVTPPTTSIQRKTGRANFSVSSEHGLTHEYYRPNLTVPELLKLAASLAKTCAYPKFTANLDIYKKGTAYACITFQKRIDHAETDYLKLCRTYGISEEQRKDLATLNFAVPLEMLEPANTALQIAQLDQIRTAFFQTFVTKAYINGAPADKALESIYRPSFAQRLALHEGHPHLYEYIACTDILVFAYKRVL